MSNARELGDLGGIVNVDDGNVGIGGDTTGVVAGVSVTSKFCVKNEGDSPVAGFVHVNNATAGSGSGTFACRSRGTTASPAIVQNNDALWNMFVAGYDGTDLALAAQISVEVDGTPGSNDMPGRILFKTTPDGQQAPVERMRIASDGSQSSVIPGGTTLYPEFKCRAWVNFNGTGTVAIRASGNVSSITDNGTGHYTVNFTNAMPDGNYAVSGIGRLDSSSDQRVPDIGIRRGSTPSTTSVQIQCTEGQLTAFDCDFVTISITR
jgi:hypothetical protein